MARRSLSHIQGLGEVQRLRFAAALGGCLAAGPIKQDSAHQRGCHGEEMRAVLPVHLLRVHQAQIHLVNQIRALQAVSCALILQQVPSLSLIHI